MTRLFLTIVSLLTVVFQLTTVAQTERKYIRSGNEYYNKASYDTAIFLYNQAIIEKPDGFEAHFNKANALYKKAEYEEAATIFKNLAAADTNALNRSKAYHNLGNCLLKQLKFEESKEAYKNALRNNPSDMDSKYNLSYLNKMLRKDEEKNGKGQQQNQQDQQDQKKQEDQKNQQDQQKQNEEKNKQEQGGQKNEPQMNQKEAERMLKALERDEKELQEKLQKQKMQGEPVQIEKDW